MTQLLSTIYLLHAQHIKGKTYISNQTPNRIVVNASRIVRIEGQTGGMLHHCMYH